MRAFLQDLRYGVRTLTRTPGFTVIAIGVLALGIGANALVFSLANTVFLRPLPAADPDTVVRVYSNRFSNTSHATYLALRDRNSTLAGLASFEMRSFGLRIDRRRRAGVRRARRRQLLSAARPDPDPRTSARRNR